MTCRDIIDNLPGWIRRHAVIMEDSVVIVKRDGISSESVADALEIDSDLVDESPAFLIIFPAEQEANPL